MTEFKPMTSKIVGMCSINWAIERLMVSKVHVLPLLGSCVMCPVYYHCLDSLSLSVYTVIITLLTNIESYYLVLVHFQCHGSPYFLQEDCQQCSLSVFLPHLTRIHNGELGRVEGDKATDPTQRMIHHLWLLYIVLPTWFLIG